MRRLVEGVVAFLALCLASQSACADKRVAFVVGNSKYQNVIALPNPANDAAAIADMFRKARFEVVESRREEHTTPRGAVQQFTWVAARMNRGGYG